MTDFEEYIRQSEPHKREKGSARQTAICLQVVDGLKTSDYLRKNELRNRYLHVLAESQSAAENAPKCNICTLNCTLEELALLNFIKEKPNATQKEIAAHIGKSERTVKTMTVKLSEQGIIERKNGRRNGYWVIKNSKTNN
mgnify:FL=1